MCFFLTLINKPHLSCLGVASEKKMQSVSGDRYKAGTKQRAKIQFTGLNLRLIHLE